MKLISFGILFLSLNSFAIELWKNELTCFSKSSKTSLVLTRSIDNDGLERNIKTPNSEQTIQCTKNAKQISCNTNKLKLSIDISTKKLDQGILLPFGQRAGMYYYYEAKLKKSFSFFSKKIRCRGKTFMSL